MLMSIACFHVLYLYHILLCISLAHFLTCLPCLYVGHYYLYVQAPDCHACVLVAAETGAIKPSGVRTVYGCSDCNPSVPLHRSTFFEVYHKKVAQGQWQVYAPRKARKKAKKTRSEKRKYRGK